MAQSKTESSPQPASSQWLFGPRVDLLAGCGLGYFVVFLLLVATSSSVELWLPLGLLPLISLVAGAPHYGATLLRVLQEPEDRERYSSIVIGTTVVMAAAFLLSLKVHVVGTILLSLYLLFWSPWHYSAQNYGLALMFLGRRRVSVDPLTRRIVRSTFILPLLIFIFQTNGQSAGSLFGSYGAPDSNPVLNIYRVVPIGIPADLQSFGMIALISIYFAAILVAGWRLLRESSLADVAPSFVIMASQSLWFTLPSCARYWQFWQDAVPLGSQSAVYAFQWVAAAHAIQYLWITMYFQRKANTNRSSRRFYFNSMLAGQALWTVPAFLFAPAFGAGLAFSPDLAILIAAVVNLHHFILDGFIWKLRDSRVNSVLVKSRGSTGASRAPLRRPLLRPIAIGVGCLILLVEATTTVERHAFAEAMAGEDLPRADSAANHLGWVGRADSVGLSDLGFLAEKFGDGDLAIESFRRSAVARDNPGAHYELARLYLDEGKLREGADELELAYSASDDFPASVIPTMAQLLTRVGRAKRAVEILEAGRLRYPDDREIESQLRLLEQAIRASD